MYNVRNKHFNINEMNGNQKCLIRNKNWEDKSYLYKNLIKE